MAEATFTFDLHVLSTPPAFNLSQNQTLQLKTFDSKNYFFSLNSKFIFQLALHLSKNPPHLRLAVYAPSSCPCQPFFQRNLGANGKSRASIAEGPSPPFPRSCQQLFLDFLIIFSNYLEIQLFFSPASFASCSKKRLLATPSLPHSFAGGISPIRAAFLFYILYNVFAATRSGTGMHFLST